MVKSLSKDDLVTFQEAVLKDHGVKLEGQELYNAAFNLLQFIEALMKFSKADDDRNKTKGSKGDQDNPLITNDSNDKME